MRWLELVSGMPFGDESSWMRGPELFQSSDGSVPPSNVFDFPALKITAPQLFFYFVLNFAEFILSSPSRDWVSLN
jgi:hypothetical protein